MEVPRWKKVLSYLIDWHLESASSPINPNLHVSLSRGEFQLSTARAIYSFGNLYGNFARTFRRLDLNSLPVENVLLLGLGLGSVPYMLERTYGKKYHYTAVEIDESVVYLANKYVLSGLQSPVEIICADARDFAQQCTESFDLIVMDIFLDDIIPEDFESVVFLRRLSGLLSPRGLLLYNRLSRTLEDLKKTRTFYTQFFHQVFPAAGYLDVGGNWILVSRSDSFTPNPTTQ